MAWKQLFLIDKGTLFFCNGYAGQSSPYSSSGRICTLWGVSAAGLECRGTAGLLCRQQATCSALFPPTFTTWCDSSGAREQGSLEITGMMLKGEEAWPETWGWEWRWSEGCNGVMVTESGGTGCWCNTLLLLLPAFCLLALVEKEELGQRLRGGRAGRRGELGSSTVTLLLWRGSVTQTGWRRGPWAEPPSVPILSCDWLEAIPHSPVETCQSWIKDAGWVCPQLIWAFLAEAWGSFCTMGPEYLGFGIFLLLLFLIKQNVTWWDYMAAKVAWTHINHIRWFQWDWLRDFFHCDLAFCVFAGRKDACEAWKVLSFFFQKCLNSYLTVDNSVSLYASEEKKIQTS